MRSKLVKLVILLLLVGVAGLLQVFRLSARYGRTDTCHAIELTIPSEFDFTFSREMEGEYWVGLQVERLYSVERTEAFLRGPGSPGGVASPVEFEIFQGTSLVKAGPELSRRVASGYSPPIEREGRIVRLLWRSLGAVELQAGESYHFKGRVVRAVPELANAHPCIRIGRESMVQAASFVNLQVATIALCALLAIAGCLFLGLLIGRVFEHLLREDRPV